MKYLGYTLQKNGGSEKHLREGFRKAMIAMKSTWSIGEKIFGKDYKRRMKMFRTLVFEHIPTECANRRISTITNIDHHGQEPPPRVTRLLTSVHTASEKAFGATRASCALAAFPATERVLFLFAIEKTRIDALRRSLFQKP